MTTGFSFGGEPTKGGFQFGNSKNTSSGTSFRDGRTVSNMGDSSGFSFGHGSSASGVISSGRAASVRALAWDPTSTASLSVCPPPSLPSSKPEGEEKEAVLNLGVVLSHDGTGCPPEQTECLIRYLDARDEWLSQKSSPSSSLLGLSMDYRSACYECLEKAVAEPKHDMEEEDVSPSAQLLSLIYALSHLTEIFLLPTTASWNPYMPNASNSRIDGPAGSLSADIVRYLRSHHSKTVFEVSEVQEMLESDQPECHPTPAMEGPYDRPYWNVLFHLVRQGSLDKAWSVLSRHSACRRAEEEAARQVLTGNEGEMSPEGEGFATLRAILLSAPIPGGRGDVYCDDEGLNDFLEEEILKKEQKEAMAQKKSSWNDPMGDEVEENVDYFNRLFIDGVPRNAYLLWETHPQRADEMRTLRHCRARCWRQSKVSSGESSQSFPEYYQMRIAMNAFEIWQDTVRNNAFPRGYNSGAATGGLAVLFRRYPPLEQIMSLLVGVIPPAIVNDSNLTWSDVLLMELLYVRPDMMPEDISTRAHVAMRQELGNDENIGGLQEIILSVMEGSAGRALEAMFVLFGGSSGAALPATMTSLLCNLLVDAGCVSPQVSSVNIQTELLLSAAEAILSSFSVQKQCDVGVRLAIRLLLPHAPPKRALSPSWKDMTAQYDEGKESNAQEIIYEPRISATIAEALSHRCPVTDAEARDLLQLCKESVQLGSVCIANECESIAFSRASVHRINRQLKLEAYWLLSGMEVLSCWLPDGLKRTLGFASRHRFDAMCEQMANVLLHKLVTDACDVNRGAKNDAEEISLLINMANVVLDVVLDYDSVAPVLKGHVQSNLLRYVVDIAVGAAEGDTRKVARNIVHSLEECCVEEGGDSVVVTLANPTMYFDFLRFAVVILDNEEKKCRGTMKFADTVFDVHGINILMARMTQILSWEGAICSIDGLSKTVPAAKKELFAAMRSSLCNGLARAFLNANSEHQNKSTTDSSTANENDSFVQEFDALLMPCI